MQGKIWRAYKLHVHRCLKDYKLLKSPLAFVASVVGTLVVFIIGTLIGSVDSVLGTLITSVDSVLETWIASVVSVIETWIASVVFVVGTLIAAVIEILVASVVETLVASAVDTRAPVNRLCSESHRSGRLQVNNIPLVVLPVEEGSKSLVGERRR